MKRGALFLSVMVTTAAAGAAGFAVAWNLHRHGREGVPEAPTPASAVTMPAEAPPALSADARIALEAPPIAAAYEVLSAAWAQHEARFAGGADPVAATGLDGPYGADPEFLVQRGATLFESSLGSPQEKVHASDGGGPGAYRCGSCHRRPHVGGAGAAADNIRVAATGRTPDTALARNPPGLAGSALLELLAAEMSSDLQRIVEEAHQIARETGEPVEMALQTKGVSFGEVTVAPNGFRNRDQVEGVGRDLVVRPLGWKGSVGTLAEAIEQGLAGHLGVGGNVGTRAALDLYVATLPLPGVRIPDAATDVARWEHGQRAFESLGCATCHRPFLVLTDPVYRLRVGEETIEIDLAQQLSLDRDPQGGWRVWLYADLKRHPMGSRLSDGRLHHGIPGELFRTAPLWGVGDTGPYLHDGSAPGLLAAIRAHDGEALTARDAFLEAEPGVQAELLQFLQALTYRRAFRVR